MGFMQVVSVNFHPFYRNAKEVVKKEVFQVHHTRICVQHDIFAQKSESLDITDKAINNSLTCRDPETQVVVRRKKINFIIVGPFVQETTIRTGECTAQYMLIIVCMYSEPAH